jgi:hypothetical protein
MALIRIDEILPDEESVSSSGAFGAIKASGMLGVLVNKLTKPLYFG